MTNKKGNVTVIAIIIVIVALTASVITWLVATKKQTTSQQTATQPTSLPQQPQQPIPTTQQNVQNQQQLDLPLINLNKFTKEEAGKKINHVTVEYKRSSSDDNKTIHDFTYEAVPNLDATYKVSYLSQKYLVVTQCGGMAPCSPYLFDLNKLQQVNVQFPMTFGSILFFENEKYVAFKGIGRFAEPGISIEVIDGKKVYCLISSEEVSDVNVTNGVMSFTEYTLVAGKDGIGKDVVAKKDINITEFCKNK